MTLRVRNDGDAAPQASVMDAVPGGLRLITSSLTLDGGGSLTFRGNRIDWSGGLEAGAAITVTYAVSVPAFSVAAPADYYHTARMDDGAGRISQSALWLTPVTRVMRLPMALR
jgi:hypothetical protein